MLCLYYNSLFKINLRGKEIRTPICWLTVHNDSQGQKLGAGLLYGWQGLEPLPLSPRVRITRKLDVRARTQSQVL